jgi:hypothetical protein
VAGERLMPEAPIKVHQEWLGLVQPVGLVVVPSALVSAGIIIEETERTKWQAYGAMLVADQDTGTTSLPDFIAFADQVLAWDLATIAGTPNGRLIPTDLTVALPELQTHLAPSLAVPEPDSPGTWQLLVRVAPVGTDLDRASADATWTASPHDQFERLLRETDVSIGVIASDRVIRLVYAPRGESSGYLSFPVAAMATVAGRPMFLALLELLKGWRLSRACPSDGRLGSVLRESRKYQNTVSAKLAEQVLAALYELMRGIQSADEAAKGLIVQETLREAPQEIYGGLLTTIMRVVFVLYAEERGMLPQDASWVEHYGVGALYHRLAQDRARYPDTMDQRFGAWARLLTLARILHDGARHAGIKVPPRAGELFDPDRYPFLEGRPFGTRRVVGERLAHAPRVSDGCLLRVLEHLLVLNGERLSYRALDVEQIGSVYEAMMGFEVRAAAGISIAVLPKTKAKGSPSHPVCDLDALLRIPGRDRAKWLKESCECDTPPAQLELLKAATSIDGLVEALQRRISPYTPLPVPRGGLTLHPTEERRRSGSHYTPRELTEPIVGTTLRPLFEAMGDSPTLDQILSLKICDPAMGSGAFLVGACRYLGDALVKAWQSHGAMPTIPPDEDAHLYARRLVAQQCLYGVDRNAYAVQLAKLSLWLVTLAREHPFTFLDHALRHGDTLVGLTRRQIQTFHWKPGGGEEPQLWSQAVDDRLREADALREQIEVMAASDDTREKQRLLADADGTLHGVRRVGDAVIAAFFNADKDRKREELRKDHEERAARALSAGASGLLDELADGLRERHLVPFHWEVEFPEVFQRDRPGFDAIVGNPPFAGKNTLIRSNPEHYLPWLQTLHGGAHGNADLVAHFFRRAHGLLRPEGVFGLIATNTIAQGDTRTTGLRWLRQHACTLYDVTRRYKWPGVAAVMVSVVHGVKGPYAGRKRIDGAEVPLITAFLFHRGSDDDPAPLLENSGKGFIGSYLLGMGFTFDDENEEATPISEMARLIAENPRNQEVIFPYIGGEEVNDSPTHAHRRYVINFGDMGEAEARTGWPELMRIVEEKVRPGRERDNRASRRQHWWQFAEKSVELTRAQRGLDVVTVISRVGQYGAWTRVPARQVLAESLVAVTVIGIGIFTILQSRSHELWARFFGSTLEDRLRYTPTDCLETFPFPANWQTSPTLEAVGQAYYDCRARLMVACDQGLTDTYSRFHDPSETSVDLQRLRDLHVAMDRAVLDAYGWTDLAPVTEFIPEFDEDEIEPGTRARRKYRLRWPDEQRDEVLARLLELNRRRAQ